MFSSTLFRKTFNVNVFGVVDMTTVTLPYLRASKGSIINIGSRSAWKTEIPVSQSQIPVLVAANSVLNRVSDHTQPRKLPSMVSISSFASFDTLMAYGAPQP